MSRCAVDRAYGVPYFQEQSTHVDKGKNMTTFEWASISYYMAQLGIIAWGIWEMRKNNTSREASTALMIQQAKALEEMGAGLREQSAGLREQSAGLREQSAGLRELLERSAPASPRQ